MSFSFFFCAPSEKHICKHDRNDFCHRKVNLHFSVLTQESVLISVLPLFKCGVYVIRLTPTCFSSLSFATNDLDNSYHAVNTYFGCSGLAGSCPVCLNDHLLPDCLLFQILLCQLMQLMCESLKKITHHTTKKRHFPLGNLSRQLVVFVGIKQTIKVDQYLVSYFAVLGVKSCAIIKSVSEYCLILATVANCKIFWSSDSSTCQDLLEHALAFTGKRKKNNTLREIISVHGWRINVHVSTELFLEQHALTGFARH